MLKREENELVTRVSAGTPMGNVMRRYWLPAALSTELPNADSDPVRLRNVTGEPQAHFSERLVYGGHLALGHGGRLAMVNNRGGVTTWRPGQTAVEQLSSDSGQAIIWNLSSSGRFLWENGNGWARIWDLVERRASGCRLPSRLRDRGVGGRWAGRREVDPGCLERLTPEVPAQRANLVPRAHQTDAERHERGDVATRADRRQRDPHR